MSSELATIVTALTMYALAVLSPGPAFALVTRLAASGERRTALGATLGFSLGAMFYAILSMTGLALIITSVAGLASLIQIAGGCYLIYLGLSAWHNRSAAKPDGTRFSKNPPSATRGLRMGLLVELSNPKGIAFFISFFAVAIPADTALWAKAVILAGGFSLEIIWYGIAAFLLSTQPVRIKYERCSIWIDRTIGTFLAVFGIRLIAEKI